MLQTIFRYASSVCQVCFKYSPSSKHQVCDNALLFLPPFYRFEIQVESQVFPAVPEGVPSLAQVIIETDRVLTFDLFTSEVF